VDWSVDVGIQGEIWWLEWGFGEEGEGLKGGEG
jgi:hypothetical protein